MFAKIYRNAIRPWLPGVGPVRYAGVPISIEKKWGDHLVPTAFLPFQGYDIPDYEDGLIRGIKKDVRTGDRIVVVGGGEGVTAVVAALATGPEGHVDCFEGSIEQLHRIERTVERNEIRNITLHHAIVGENLGVYGSDSSAKTLAPERLPACDVLELDCEGSELEILKRIAFTPRAILVETHGFKGATSRDIRSILENMKYTVADLGWAEPNRLEECKAGDVRVLAAT